MFYVIIIFILPVLTRVNSVGSVTKTFLQVWLWFLYLVLQSDATPWQDPFQKLPMWRDTSIKFSHSRKVMSEFRRKFYFTEIPCYFHSRVWKLHITIINHTTFLIQLPFYKPYFYSSSVRDPPAVNRKVEKTALVRSVATDANWLRLPLPPKPLAWTPPSAFGLFSHRVPMEMIAAYLVIIQYS
jgi:hypothetical protein